MDLTGGARGLTEAEKANLGAVKAQAGLGPKSAIRIEKAIDDSFVVGFRAAMVAPATLTLAGALVAALFVGGNNGLTRLPNGTATRTLALRRVGVGWEEGRMVQGHAGARAGHQKARSA
jgi:hypothetical protein